MDYLVKIRSVQTPLNGQFSIGANKYPSESLKIPTSGKLLQLNYEGFTIWLDCEKRGSMKFQYNAQHDTGNEVRTKSFKFDPNIPAECQQTSTKGYGHGYDRGHQLCNLRTCCLQKNALWNAGFA
jgi:endonuclease G